VEKSARPGICRLCCVNTPDMVVEKWVAKSQPKKAPVRVPFLWWREISNPRPPGYGLQSYFVHSSSPGSPFGSSLAVFGSQEPDVIGWPDYM
jgi:hypothetical protein